MQLKPYKRYDRKHGQTYYYYKVAFNDRVLYEEFVEKCYNKLGEMEPNSIFSASVRDRYRWFNQPEKLAVCIKDFDDLKKVIDTVRVLYLPEAKKLGAYDHEKNTKVGRASFSKRWLHL